MPRSPKRPRSACKSVLASSSPSSPVRVSTFVLGHCWFVGSGLTVSCTASEKCHQEKRKTVNGEDILFAMSSLGFENYGEALKIYLSKYREVGYPPFLFKYPCPDNIY
jgi:hypothetical protein